ncbi:MAG: hypothetical protein IJ756_07885 [Paludibacteraceae bacterium]|nr:hypothetical protein [Paludibacteraceae bacterium]
MKKSIFMLFALCLTLGATAQTYTNGTWYSLYDSSNHDLNTISNFTLNKIFSPTTGNLSFTWNYTQVELTGWFKSNATHIYESSDGGANQREIATLTNADFKEGYTFNSDKFGRNINFLRFDRPIGNTHMVSVYNLALPLAKHILLPDEGNEYGKTSAELAFEQPFPVGDLNDEPLKIQLRSFLTDGDITVSSSNPSFRIQNPFANKPYTIAVGANACASANGAEGTECSEGVLGDINFYTIDVYFSPVAAGLQEGTITITDGTSTAIVTVTGQGTALSQEISWEPETEILTNAEIALATASSGLACTYTFEPEGIVAFEDGALKILSDGEVDITAHQAGNEVYSAAENVVKHFIIHPASTAHQIDAVVCEGEKAEYNGEEYEAGTHTFNYTDKFGADSIVVFVVSELPVYDLTEEQTITEGDEFEWNGVLYTDSVAGEYTQVFEGKTELGCDSIVTLVLTIEAAQVDALEDVLFDGEKPVKFFHDGKVYIRKGEEIFDAKGQKVQ